MLGATDAGGRRGSTDGGERACSGARYSGQLRKSHASVPRVAERARPRSAVAVAAASDDGGEPYWTVSRSTAARTLSCRECKGVIYKGQPYVARDGRKIRLVRRRLHAPHMHTCTHTEPLLHGAVLPPRLLLGRRGSTHAECLIVSYEHVHARPVSDRHAAGPPAAGPPRPADSHAARRVQDQQRGTRVQGEDLKSQ